MTSVGDYFTKMLDNSLDWKGIETINKQWGGQFALKGIMSVEDEIGRASCRERV